MTWSLLKYTCTFIRVPWSFSTYLHGVMKFEKETQCLWRKIADRQPSLTSSSTRKKLLQTNCKPFPIFSSSSILSHRIIIEVNSHHNLWPIHIIIEAVSTQNYKSTLQSTNYLGVIFGHFHVIIVSPNLSKFMSIFVIIYGQFNSKVQITSQFFFPLKIVKITCQTQLVILSRFVKTRRSSRHRDLSLLQCHRDLSLLQCHRDIC
jgi:hypothetical protein